MRASTHHLTLAIWLAVASSASAATWYVASEAGPASANTGLSWTNAWTNLASVVWSGIAPGDTLKLGGGPAGTTNDYAAALSQYNQTVQDGTSNSPIWIRFDGTNALHNGGVKLWEIYLKGAYWKIDGSRDGLLSNRWYPKNVLENYLNATNIAVWITGTNGGGGVRFEKQDGIDLYWLGFVDRWVKYDTEQIGCTAYNTSTALDPHNEFAYLYMTNVFDYIFKVIQYPDSKQQFGRLNIHNILVRESNDNFSQDVNCMDVHDSVMVTGHRLQRDSDGWQTGNSYFRIWNNYIAGYTTGVLSPLAAGTNLDTQVLSDWYVFNNVFFGVYDDPALWNRGDPSTNWFGANQDCHWDTWAGMSDGGGAYVPPTNLIFTNWWICNNVFYDEFGGALTSFNAWTSAGVITNPTCGSYVWLNNIIIAPTNNSTPLIKFNAAGDPPSFFGGVYGFSYITNLIPFDFNDVFNWQGPASGLSVYYSTNEYLPTQFPASWGFGSGNTTNRMQFVWDAPKTNPTYLFHPVWRTPPAGTNLSGTLIAQNAPWITNDILGNPRGANWDIGPYQRDPSLLLWLTFNNWDGANTNILDDSGNTNTANILGLWVTNTPTLTNGPTGFGNAAHFTGNGYSGGECTACGQWLAVQPFSGNLRDLTNATVALWAEPEAVSSTEIGNSGTLLDALYLDGSSEPVEDGWRLGRYYYYGVGLTLHDKTEGIDLTNKATVLYWPDYTGDGNNGDPTNMVTGWHHYAFTYDGTNIIGYYDGAAFATTNVSNWIDRLHLHSTAPDWLAIGCWQHDYASTVPNTGWWKGGIDDIRIYNRALSGGEIATLAANVPVSIVGTSGEGGGGGGGGGGGSGTNGGTPSVNPPTPSGPSLLLKGPL